MALVPRNSGDDIAVNPLPQGASSDMDGKTTKEGGDLLDPMPELPDNTPLNRVRFPARICKALEAGGFRTIGEIREASDETLLNLQGLGSGSISDLRATLGLPSCDGVSSLEKKPR